MGKFSICYSGYVCTFSLCLKVVSRPSAQRTQSTVFFIHVYRSVPAQFQLIYTFQYASQTPDPAVRHEDVRALLRCHTVLGLSFTSPMRVCPMPQPLNHAVTQSYRAICRHGPCLGRASASSCAKTPHRGPLQLPLPSPPQPTSTTIVASSACMLIYFL
jgi:hypothetical protein